MVLIVEEGVMGSGCVGQRVVRRVGIFREAAGRSTPGRGGGRPIHRTATLLAILTYATLPAPASGAQCLAGEYWDGSRCLSCSTGFYCPGDDSQILCPAGTYGSTTDLTSSACSGLCQTGYYCPAGSTSANMSACTLGSFCEPGATADADCGLGHYCQSTILRKICPDGSYCAGTRETAVTGPCTSGSYCPAGTSTANPDCEIGDYCPTPAERFACPAGTYGSEARLTSSSCSGQCQAGRYCLAASTTLLGSGSCDAGYYCATGSTTALGAGPCDAGYYCPAGSTTALGAGPCDAGYYCPAGSKTALGAGPCDVSCAACDELSSTDCTSCADGYSRRTDACTLTVTLNAAPLLLGAGEQTQLAWSSPAAATCTATVDWSGSMPASGSAGVLVTTTSLFELNCVDALGSRGGDSVTVTVSGVLNDACLTAEEIPAARLFRFDDAVNTIGATAHASDPKTPLGCGSGRDGSTVWYRYTAPVSGTFEISTDGSDYNTVISAWDDAEGCGSLVTAIACNDDGPTPPQSNLVFTLDAGSTYLFQVGARSGGAGGHLSVRAIPEPSREWLNLAALASLLLLRRFEPGKRVG